MNNALREQVRVAEGRNPQPSACSLDSQSAHTTPNGGERGYDGYKRVNGRKRFILVDTLGSVMRVQVTPANLKETGGGMDLLQGAQLEFPKVTKLWADQGFRLWEFNAWVGGALCWDLELTSGVGKPGQAGFRALGAAQARQRSCPSAPQARKVLVSAARRCWGKSQECGADVCVVVEVQATLKGLRGLG